MKIVFVVSSIGDTDLALGTVKSLEKNNQDVVTFIALTKTALDRIEKFNSTLPVEKKALYQILHREPNYFPESCTEIEIEKISQFIDECHIEQAYIGVPSTLKSKTPFQIAQSVKKIPVLMAYEFMFKPEAHSLWEFVPTLNAMPNIKWAVPLDTAVENFSTTCTVGHLSIDNAFPVKQPSEKSAEEIRQRLQIESGQSLVFLSSTTQPIEVDLTFLDVVLTELPHHPTMQVRLGIHPGIQDLNTYLTNILSVFERHGSVLNQFKIILPNSLLPRISESIASQPVFLRTDVNGPEAGWAADKVGQAVPGALLNQAALEGKPVYSHSGKPYLPASYFSENIASFFSAQQQEPRHKNNLNLDEKSASENCATILTR
jgi:hypothetical protein